MKLQQLVTIKVAAEYFGVCDRTMRRWMRAGRIRAYKTEDSGSGQIRFRVDDMARLLASMKVKVK